MVAVLPNDITKPTTGFDPATVLSEVRGIRSAEPEGSWITREARSEKEAESLVSWADGKGALWTETKVPESDELTGGEHIVELDERSDRVFKSTLPGKFGFAIDLEMISPKGRNSRPRITAGLCQATPDEYLQRLAWQNELFNDRERVVGVVKYPQGISVLSLQPFYKGEKTAQSAIDEWFKSKGWMVLPKEGAYDNRKRDLMIMDAIPRNVLTLENGDIMPFDVVIVKPSQAVKNKFGL